jgi:protein phosphatase
MLVQVPPVPYALEHSLTVDPHWLIYLPAGMVSAQNTVRGEALEDPRAALAYYSQQGIPRVLVQTKHMGSRGIAIVCRDDVVAQKRFGVPRASPPGEVYTRNGRPFFANPKDRTDFLDRLRQCLTAASLWDELGTDWLCLDGEILPWSLKAGSLLEQNVPRVFGAGWAVASALNEFAASAPSEIASWARSRFAALTEYVRTVEKYFGERGRSVQFAPFQVLAGEGATFFEKSHRWHVDLARRLVQPSRGFVVPTFSLALDVDDEHDGIRLSGWWKTLCEERLEGVVVKPWRPVSKNRRGGHMQPGIKCRTPEHLRLVYGPEYDSPQLIEKFRERSALTRRRQKHRRSLKQFALSLEGLNRFVRREPLESVRECVVGVLALERGLRGPDSR